MARRKGIDWDAGKAGKAGKAKEAKGRPYDAPIPIGGRTLGEIEADIRKLEEETARLTEWSKVNGVA